MFLYHRKPSVETLGYFRLGHLRDAAVTKKRCFIEQARPAVALYRRCNTREADAVFE
jgi:hypothetical protein